MNRALWRLFIMVCTMVTMSGLVLSTHSAYAESAKRESAITEWQMLWEQPGEEMTIEEVSVLADDEGWFQVKAGEEYPAVPEHIKSAWIRFQIPEMTQMRPALDINKLYAKNVVMYIDGEVMYERYRNYSFDTNEMVVPVGVEESYKTIFVKLDINTVRLGLYNGIAIGEYDDLFKQFIQRDLLDVVLGAALIFIAFFMMVSGTFVSREFQLGWNSLFLLMLSIGVMILTYSTFLDKFFPEYGVLFYILFDVAATLLLPSLFFFFEKIFGRGPFGLVTKYKTFQMYFSPLYIIMLVLSSISETVASAYYGVGFIIFGSSIIVGNIILIYSLIHEFRSRNKEAIILSVGISIFAGVSLIEILWFFYSEQMYRLFFWKISILFFLASLIIILVRRVMQNYKQAVDYSRQVEIFNNELQRSEKIELISNLAASIAHEVRNPLQVTRGFLQLLGEKTPGSKDKGYMSLAIEELDRASEIITDFLTFAKPDLGEVMRLNTADEIQHIAAILAPLATMQGGVLRTKVEENLFVRGNSSRFKQALINIIKNSIEAFREDGEVKIHVSKEQESNQIVIYIKDNGEGIEKEDLKRLGEPYYSKKTKGTGLGLMVTYRIIEAMDGEILFESKRGVGTEVCIRIPEAI